MTNRKLRDEKWSSRVDIFVRCRCCRVFYVWFFSISKQIEISKTISLSFGFALEKLTIFRWRFKVTPYRRGQEPFWDATVLQLPCDELGKHLETTAWTWMSLSGSRQIFRPLKTDTNTRSVGSELFSGAIKSSIAQPRQVRDMIFFLKNFSQLSLCVPSGGSFFISSKEQPETWLAAQETDKKLRLHRFDFDVSFCCFSCPLCPTLTSRWGVYPKINVERSIDLPEAAVSVSHLCNEYDAMQSQRLFWRCCCLQSGQRLPLLPCQHGGVEEDGKSWIFQQDESGNMSGIKFQTANERVELIFQS